MTCCTDNQLTQIIGAAFSIQLSSVDSPIVQGGVPLADVAGWIPRLQVLLNGRVVETINGTWGAHVTPFKSIFEQTNTSAWKAGDCDIRIMYIAPNGSVYAPQSPVIAQITVTP